MRGEGRNRHVNLVVGEASGTGRTETRSVCVVRVGVRVARGEGAKDTCRGSGRAGVLFRNRKNIYLGEFPEGGQMV